MKKIYIYLSAAVLSLTAINAKAQDNADKYVKSYIGFFGGLSTPISNFKLADYNNNQAGFAKKGVTFGLDGAWYLYKNLGIGATISFQDQGEFKQGDVDALATGFTTSFSADGATVTTVGRYHSFNALIGPQYAITFGKNFIVDLRAQAGVMHGTSSPEITTTLTGSATQTTTFYQRSAKGNAFAYGGNLGLRYKLSDGVSLVLRGAYINSKGLNITNDDRTVATGRLVTRQPVTVIQSTLGFNFMF